MSKSALYFMLHKYVGTYGIEAALCEFPDSLNLSELIKHNCAPKSARLRIHKQGTGKNAMWFVAYGEPFNGGSTVYFQHNNTSLTSAIVNAIAGLIDLGVMSEDYFTRKVEEYESR